MTWLCFAVIAELLRLFSGRTQEEVYDDLAKAVGAVNSNPLGRDSISNRFTARTKVAELQSVARRARHADVVRELSKYREYITDVGARKRLILALQRIIREDDAHPDTVVDIIGEKKKNEILVQTEFNFAAFLAGVYLYAIRINNTLGRDAVLQINEAFLSTYNGQEDSVTFIECTALVSRSRDIESLVATNAKLIPWYIASSMRTEDRSMIVTLLTETKGSCLNCGTRLGLPKEGQPVDYCEVIYLNPANSPDVNSGAYDNAVAVCIKCARELQFATPEKVAELADEKRRMAQINMALECAASIPIERQIEEVLRDISGIQDPEMLRPMKDPVKIDRKVTHLALKLKTKNYVTMYYYAVHDALARLAGEKRLNTSKLARSIRQRFEEVSERLSSQDEIYDVLVNAIYERTGRKNKEACEIVIAYFVQSCEVFDEIPG